MEYSGLGNSGVQVSRLCLGAMMFGSPTNESDSIKIIERAFEAGINFIDTANVYNAGESERIVGKAVRAFRDDVLIATKVSGAMGEGLNRSGTSRHHIMMAVEDSLRRLDTDRIDLYYLHRWNALTPIEESLRALDDCVRQGKVRYIAGSNFDAWRLCEAWWKSDRMNLEKICLSATAL